MSGLRLAHTALARWLADRRGVSAVEFALIAPAVIAIYFGMVEFTQAAMVDRKAIMVVSSIGDLAAQDKQLTNAEMSDIFSIGAKIVAPFPTSSLKMRISQISSNASNVKTVTWSDASGMSPLTVGATHAVSDSLLSASQSILLAEAQLNYSSPVGYFIPTATNFSKSIYLRPRLSTSITRVP